MQQMARPQTAINNSFQQPSNFFAVQPKKNNFKANIIGRKTERNELMQIPHP